MNTDARSLSPEQKKALHKLFSEEAFRSPQIRRATRDNGPMPLSFPQQRLWFLHEYEQSKSLYNMPLMVRLKGKLDLAALERSINEIVRRHESLRTRFTVMPDGIPAQVVEETPKFDWDVIDLQNVDEAEQVQRLIRKELNAGFDLRRELLRVRLLRVGAEEHVLLVVMHHIVSDGWSLGIFTRELAQLYEAFSSGEERKLEELAFQYADYAVWQREWMQGEVLEKQLRYWKEQLRELPELLELSMAKVRPAVASHEGGVWRFEWGEEMVAGLKEVSRAGGVTLFMTLLAGLQVVLQRYSGQEEIAVGSPIAGRNWKEVEGLIGLFVNTLVLRTRVDGNRSFVDLLRRVREVALGAYRNQDVPFEKLVEELQPARNLGRNPLFQVMLVLQNAPEAKWELTGLQLEQEAIDTGTTKFDLTVIMREENKRLRGALEYRKDLFEEEAMKRIARHLEVLLRDAVQRPQKRIAELQMLTEDEQQQVLYEWNQTERGYAREACVHELFERQVERTPDEVAVECEGRRLSYRELNRSANQVAARLAEAGVQAEVRVGICLERNEEMVVAILAVLKAGGAYVPLDPEYPAERLRYIVKDARIAVLVTRAVAEEKVGKGFAGPRVELDRDWKWMERYSGENRESGTDETNLAYVLYTSGSTGQPKGVCIEHRQLRNYVQAIAERIGGERCSFVMAQPLTVDASITALYPPLLSGGCVTVVSRAWSLDVECMKKLFAGGEKEGLKIAPSHLAALHQGAGESRKKLMPSKLLVLGGEASAWSWMKELQEMAPGCSVFNHYGPTETTVGVLAYRYGEEGPEKEYGSSPLGTPLGTPLGNTQVYVLDGEMNAAPVGVRGEIYIGGANVGRGYLERGEMTAERFVPNPFAKIGGERLYRTGDWGRWTGAGQVEFLGRGDDQVKVRGFRIELGEIEAVVLGHVGVAQAAVAVKEAKGEGNGGTGDKRLVGYVVGKGGQEISGRELREWVRERLPEHMVPSDWVMLEEMPRTPHGKLDRSKLPDPEIKIESLDYVPPRTPVEQTVAEIWADVLKIPKIGIHENFFEVGGHSILAMQIVNRTASAFNIRLPLVVIFDAATIATFSEIVSEFRERATGRFESHEDTDPAFF